MCFSVAQSSASASRKLDSRRSGSNFAISCEAGESQLRCEARETAEQESGLLIFAPKTTKAGAMLLVSVTDDRRGNAISFATR